MPATRTRASSSRYDLVVIGAGPAGTTLASLVKRYNPEAKVLILEAAVFPRHHIGESLLPGAVPVLQEMGAYDKIAAAGFLKKIGVVFVWGKDREPWDATFDRLKFLASKKAPGGSSWHVVRSRYDALLVEAARERGVEIRMGARAVEPIERRGRIVGLVAEGPDRKAFALDCGMLADCSGQGGFLSKFRPIRRYSEDLRNVAAYGYFKGARWKIEYTGHPDKSAIFVCSVPEGWFWYIPLAPDLVSVGLVSKAEYVARRKVADYRKFFLDAIAGCSEIRPLLAKARMIEGMDPRDPKKDFFTIKDWSFASVQSCGDGWIAAGDAAFFVDPLLSSGVVMAHLAGRRAAYTITSLRREKDPAVRALLRRDYGRFCGAISEGFLALVRYWYHHEPSAKDWWRRAREVVSSRSPYRLDDKDAFISVLAGVSSQFEQAYVDGGRHESGDVLRDPWGRRRRREKRSPHVPQLFLVGRNERSWKAKGAPAPGRPWDDALVPAWRLRRTKSLRLVPLAGSGLLRPFRQVAFPANGSAADDPGVPSRLMPRPCLAALDLVDGRRSVGAISEAVRARFPLPADVLDELIRALFADLEELGAVRLDARRARAAPPRPAPPALRRLREAEGALDAGRPDEAERLASLLISAGSDGAWCRALRGEARRRAGRFDAAVADLTAALSGRAGAPRRGRRRLDALLDESEELMEKSWLSDRVAAWLAAARARDASAEPPFRPEER